MAKAVRSLYFRGFVVLLFVGATLIVAGFGVWLIGGAIAGHGSSGGNVLSVLFGFMLVGLAPGVFIRGLIYWNSSRANEEEKDK